MPEYEPVDRLCLSFVEEFFNSRFNYGAAIASMARAALDLVEVEVFVSSDDRPLLESELRDYGVDPCSVTANTDSPGRGILAEYLPVFCRDSRGRGRGLLFTDPHLSRCDELRRFSGRLLDRMGLGRIEMEEGFATAKVAANEDLCLVCEDVATESAMAFLRSTFPHQEFVAVPALAGDRTTDLDMFLWPVLPGTWLVSQYSKGSSREESVFPSVQAIRNHGHRVVRLPGLDHIVEGDVDTMPNYANGVLLNGRALYPIYGRREDEVTASLLESLGLEAVPVWSGEIIRSNSGPHCICKTVPSFEAAG